MCRCYTHFFLFSFVWFIFFEEKGRNVVTNSTRNLLYTHTTHTATLDFRFLSNLLPPYICTHIVVANKMLNWQYESLSSVYIIVLFLALDTLNTENITELKSKISSPYDRCKKIFFKERKSREINNWNYEKKAWFFFTGNTRSLKSTQNGILKIFKS